MKFAFVSQLDAKDVQSWSGTPFFMVQGLRDAGHSVKAIGPLHLPFPRTLKVLQKGYQSLTGKCYDFGRHPLVAKALSRQAEQQMAGEKFDAVLCPSSIVCAGMNVDVPIVTWEDATFAGMVGYYPGKWQSFSSATVRHGNAIQQASLSNAALSVFSSEWAAQSAIENYKVDKKNVVVVPLGANLTEAPSQADVLAAVTARTQTQECRLLFIGVEWHRKGGDLVVETALALREKGINAFVDVVGCEPIGTMPDCVRTHGFVSKGTAEGREKLRTLLLNAHFLFVPSLAECFGLVFAEASAFGVPSIARATGGIPTSVQNGLNGWALDMNATAPAYAQLIASQLEDFATYRDSALRARQFYEERLNWHAAIATLTSLLEPLVPRRC